jgi:hypothetical protein
MTLIASWLRLELRRRWRSLTVLALLVAVAGATVMTSFAGARRTASVLDRLEAHTLPATAAVLANTPNFDWRPVHRLPEVEAFTTFGPTFPIEGLPPEAEAEPLLLPTTMRTIERGVVRHGRMFDSRRSDEGIISPQISRKYHLAVGDTVVVVLPTPQQLHEAVENDGPTGRYTGPRLHVHIVGIVVSRWFSDSLALSPGVARHYRANTAGSTRPDRPLYANALFRLRGGSSTMPQFRADLARVTGRPDLEVVDVDQWSDRPYQQRASFEARCLFALGLAALIAALFLVGQAIARFVATTVADLQVLRPLGLTPGQMAAAATAPLAVVGVVGGGAATAGAIAASGWIPFGSLADAEPAAGVRADWVVLAPGLVAIAVLVAAGATLAAWSALARGGRGTVARRSMVAGVAARTGLPVPVVVGARFALEPARGRNSTTVRPAVIGAVTGVLGVVAAFTFSSAVSDAAAHPERFGQTFQLSAFIGFGGQDFAPTGRLVHSLAASDRVAGVDDARVGVATGPHGHGSVSLYTYRSGRKPLDVVTVSGRLPARADEVMLAPDTLKTLDVEVGDTVPLSGQSGTSRFTVVGAGLVPAGAHNTYADGGWLTDAGYDALFHGFKFHLVYVALRPAARTAHAGAALAADLARRDHALKGVSFSTPDELTQVKTLREVRALPIALGIFLAVLAIGAVGHAVVTTVRRRSRELAVLRALGMTQQQSRVAVATHATLLGVIGILVGLPLGLALGRTVWRAVAHETPFQYIAPLAATTLAILVPATLLLANALAAVPGQLAARMRLAQVLRAE